MALRTSVTSVSKGLLKRGGGGSSCTPKARSASSAFGNNASSNRHDNPFNSGAAVTSPSAKEANLDSAFFKPSCVIFDKDGTLVCFHTMWSPWCTSFAQRMKKATGMSDISGQVYDVLGYDHEEEKIRIGALAENTHPQIKDKIYDMLMSERGFEPRQARQVVEDTWKDTPEDMSIKPTGNLHSLFQRLKAEGVKIAICTSDSQEGTREFIHRQRLDHMIDMIVCGDDAHCQPKPNPHNALYICDKLGVRPADTIMVGDTPADTLMGQQAKLGLTVGVLSGVGGVPDLVDADVIVKDVKDCVDLILPSKKADEVQKVHHVTTRGLSKIARGSLLFNRGHGSPAASAASAARFYSTTSASAAAASRRSYSHIVVGAGSAGCVMSHRLTEERQ